MAARGAQPQRRAPPSLAQKSPWSKKSYLGGSCVNYNCIPFTGMLASVELLERIRRASNLGVQVGEPTLDLPQARLHVEGIVEELRMGIGALMDSFGVQVVEGQARLVSPRTVMVGDQRLDGDAIILATGAKPSPPPFPVPGLLTCSQAMALDQAPESAAGLGQRRHRNAVRPVLRPARQQGDRGRPGR